MNNNLTQLIQFKSLGDARGSLVALEQQKEIPFDIKRVYYLFDTEANASRGYHAHFNLEQVVICLKGHVTFVVDDGTTKDSVVLDSPYTGLHIKGLKWREMHNFSEDCVLLVLASECYDEADYIRDYSEFLKATGNEDSSIK